MMEIKVKENLWFVNVGTIVPSKSTRRRWAACREYGFLSAGQGIKYKKAICKLNADDVVCAYESGTGFLAIGIVLERPVAIKKFLHNGKETLHGLPLIDNGNNQDKGLFENENDNNKSEYVAKIKWYDLNINPLWIPKGGAGFFAPQAVVAELKHKETKVAIKIHFKVDFV